MPLTTATGKRLDFAELKRLLSRTYSEWSNDQAPRLGAALAYYTTLSLAPLLVLLIALAGLVFGEQAAKGQIQGQIDEMVGPTGGQAIQQMVENASHTGRSITASIIGFLVLIVGASTVANELKNSLNIVWNKEPDPNAGLTDMVKQRSSALVVVLGAGFLLLVSLTVSSIISGAGAYLTNLLGMPAPVMQALNMALGLLVVTGVFAALFKYLPDVDIKWSDVLLGALFTAVLFTMGKYLIGLYLGQASFGSTYGAAGSLVVVLVWVYYSAQIVFFGAEFTQVYACEHGSDPQKTRAQQAAKTKISPSLDTTVAASGNPTMSSTDNRRTGVFGSLLGSALAARRIVRGFRDN